MQIFDSMMRSDDLQLEDAARSVLLEKLRQMESVVDKENGNGRAMRNLLDAAKRRQALRLQQLPGRKTVEQLRQLTVSDIQ
jgi:hypothetical protein